MPQKNGKAMDEEPPKDTILLVKVSLMLTFTSGAVPLWPLGALRGT